MKIGIIGGTGPQGKGIALRLAKAGIQVIIGSRSEERAKIKAQELNDILSSLLISGLSNIDLVNNCDILFLTTPYESVRDTVLSLVENMKTRTKILVDVTVPLTFEKGKGMVFVDMEGGSMAKYVQNLVDPIPVVGALKTIGAHALLDLEKPLERDTFVVGLKDPRNQIIELLSKIEGLRAIDAGPLREAVTIERLVPFLININRRYKVKDSGLKVIM